MSAHPAAIARSIVEIPIAWVFDEELRPTDLGTLLRIVALEEDGRADFTLEELELGVGRNGVRASVHRLIDAGYISRARIRNAGTLRGAEYRITGPR